MQGVVCCVSLECRKQQSGPLSVAAANIRLEQLPLRLVCQTYLERAKRPPVLLHLGIKQGGAQADRGFTFRKGFQPFLFDPARVVGRSQIRRLGQRTPRQAQGQRKMAAHLGRC
jgi:hypothetical protein